MPVLRRLPEGVFLGSHAVAEGVVTPAQLTRGMYRRVLRNVYADRSMPFDHELVCRAAALLMPPEAALGSRSAAVWWGGPTARTGDPVTVVVPARSAWRGPEGVRVHRSELAVRDVDVVDGGIRVTGIERTTRDVAALEKVKDAVACLDAMVASGHLTEVMIRAVDRSVAGHWGSRRVRRVLPLVDGRAQSAPESWVRVACVLAGLPRPVPQYEVVQDGAFLGRVDLAWPEARLVVEYEGAHHFDDVQIRKDDRRYAGLIAAGWRVIRLSSVDLRDLDAVVERISTALLAAAG